jgi:hypothetical protein
MKKQVHYTGGHVDYQHRIALEPSERGGQPTFAAV